MVDHLDQQLSDKIDEYKVNILDAICFDVNSLREALGCFLAGWMPSLCTETWFISHVTSRPEEGL